MRNFFLFLLNILHVHSQILLIQPDCDHDLITILFKMALRGIFGFVLYATLTEISAYVYYFIHDF